MPAPLTPYSRLPASTGDTAAYWPAASGGAASLGGSEREQLGPVLAQPVPLLAPVRTVPLDERPEAARVVEEPQMTELVHDHVVEHLDGRQHESPVEGERAAGRARPPERPLVSDADAPVGDAEPVGPLVGESRDELPCSDARLRLADREPL